MWRWFKALFGLFEISEQEAAWFQNVVSSMTAGRNREYDFAKENLAKIEARSAVLLTHVSLMIGVTGVFWATSSKGLLWDILLSVELICYLLIALFCVRIQLPIETLAIKRARRGTPKNHTDLTKQGRAVEDAIFAESYYREQMFRFAIFSVYVLTVLLALTVILGTPFSELLHKLRPSEVVEVNL